MASGSRSCLTARAGGKPVAATVFAACVAVCFGASALYHRPTWQPGSAAGSPRRPRRRLPADRRDVHAVRPARALERLGDPRALGRLGGALAAILLKLFWLGTPKWLSAAIGLALGWVAVVAISQLLKLDAGGSRSCSPAGCSTASARSCTRAAARTRSPSVFGYHELFHVLTLVAAGCMYAAVAFYVLPRG